MNACFSLIRATNSGDAAVRCRHRIELIIFDCVVADTRYLRKTPKSHRGVTYGAHASEECMMTRSKLK